MTSCIRSTCQFHHIVKKEELARRRLENEISVEMAIHDAGGYESAFRVEGVHLREAFLDIVATIEELLEGDDSLAVLQRQKEVVVVGVDVERFEFGGVVVKLLEWKLDVNECQLAKRRTAVGKRAE